MKIPKLFLPALLAFSNLAISQEPLHEAEAAKKSHSAALLTVPDKQWLGKELYSDEKGNYSALIWGHAESPKAMPPGFDVLAEIRHLVEHHIDWYAGFAPKDEAGLEKFIDWHKQTGLVVSMGFPDPEISEEAISLGAQPSNPTMVAQGKKPWVAPIDPKYLEASLKEIDARFGKGRNLDFIRAFHLQDEPVGEFPYYEIGAKSKTRLAAEWDKQVLATTGLGKWGLPKDGWDSTVPETRLAYEKFWAARFNDYQRKIAAAFRERHPEIEVWSANFWFNQGSDILEDYAEMGTFLDAVVIDSYATQQEIDFPGRGRWNAGYATKIAADLSKKPVYNHFQVLEYRGATPSPSDIYEYASQTLRGGGLGVIYYAIDTPQYKYIRYTDSARWDAMLDIAAQLRVLPKLKFPNAYPTGYWVSQETLATTGPRVKNNAAYSAYVLLGETLGAPFRFLSDWAVDRNGADELKGYKIIYAGPASWSPPGVTDKLAGWVKAGGILVLTGSDAFTRQLDGKRFPSWKEALGVTTDPKPGDAYDEWALGDGRVLQFKQDPWTLMSWTKPEVTDLIRKLQTDSGGGADEPIWRFRLPEKPAASP